MANTSKLLFLFGGISAALAVALGAFGAHALKGVLTPELRTIYQTASDYHFYHSLGLLAVALLTLHWPESVYLKWSGWLMLAGIVIFSGSLYLLSITGIRWLGAITPLGGLAFIGAWLLFVIAVVRAS